MTDLYITYSLILLFNMAVFSRKVFLLVWTAFYTGWRIILGLFNIFALIFAFIFVDNALMGVFKASQGETGGKREGRKEGSWFLNFIFEYSVYYKILSI